MTGVTSIAGTRQGRGRDRVLGAARVLFAEHGVSGTSLQMIADRLGVTKAAVYHQFHAKNDIATALLDPVMRSLQELVESVGALPDELRRDALARGMVELFVSHRNALAGLYRDPAFDRIVADDPEWVVVTVRLTELFCGSQPDVHQRVVRTVFVSGLAAVVSDPDLVHVPDDELREAMLAVALRLVT